MTWEPKNGLNDEDVDVSDEEEGDNSFTREEKPNALGKEPKKNFASFAHFATRRKRSRPRTGCNLMFTSVCHNTAVQTV